MKATQIFSDNGFLSFDSEALASSQEYKLADRCEGSIFESLEPKELIELADGQFILDSDLDLAFKFEGYSESGEEQWLDLSSGMIQSSWDLV